MLHTELETKNRKKVIGLQITNIHQILKVKNKLNTKHNKKWYIEIFSFFGIFFNFCLSCLNIHLVANVSPNYSQVEDINLIALHFLLYVIYETK